MAIGKPRIDLANRFNSVYQITEDMSGWSVMTVHVVPPMSGTIFVYGTNDSGSSQGVTQGNARLATNFTPILATNLATNTGTLTISSAGLYTIPINAQFVRLQGSPAAAGTSVYKLLLFNSKID